jgi:hypothetical protein
VMKDLKADWEMEKSRCGMGAKDFQ